MAADDLDRQVEAAFQRHKRGDLGFAHGVYRQVLAQRPDHPGALHYLGLVAQQTGHSDDAVRLLERSIAVNPKDSRVFNHLGQVRIALNDTGAAAKCFERALEIDPNHVDALNNLANVVRSRDLLQAIDLYRRALALNPRAAFATFNLAQALNEDGEFEEALALYQRTITLDARHCDARHSLGMLFEQQGQFAKAIEQYQAVQRIQPTHVSSLANLLDIRDYEPDLAMVRRAEERLKTSRVAEEDLIKLHHGLGKHYDREGDFERAFPHFVSANALLRGQGLSFDIAAVTKSMEANRCAFGPEVFADDRPVGRLSDRPIFIVGLPRSGTTLTEQILASHPSVFGAGELRKIPEMVKFLRPDYPDCVAVMSEEDLASFADEYLSVLEDLAGPEPVRVTDKLPTNSLNLGFIAKLFPNARIIHCRRDPMDVAISCFIELFELDQDYTTCFEDFGRYFLAHEGLMAHWRSALPIEIHELRYEEMVSDPETATRSLLAYCDLPWDSRCLDYTATERTVKTPSRWQVRQAIYQRSVSRWRNYAAHMEPLRTFLDESGYDYAAAGRAQSTSVAAMSVAKAKGPRPKPLRQPVFIVAAPRSGSSLLFETLAEARGFATVGGEAHWLVENIRGLRPGAGETDSNRLEGEQTTDLVADHLVQQIMGRLVDRTGRPVGGESPLVFLEKTPKNALRIPFFQQIFPEARFLFLWRDPRENISSIMEAWRSGRFITYQRLAGFKGPWSLLLPPGYRALSGRPLEEIAAFQWESANRIILEDLEQLALGRWTSVQYCDFVRDPKAETERICAFAVLHFDPDLARRVSMALPHSRYTETAPASEKWRANEAKILRVLPSVEPTWRRLQGIA